MIAEIRVKEGKGEGKGERKGKSQRAIEAVVVDSRRQNDGNGTYMLLRWL